nr:response regulator [Natronincola peptidivorans]
MKLLIVDDEHIVIESLKFIIEKHVEGVEVVGTARSGREAIEKTLNLKPDVVFMDIHMPGINGMDAIRHIQASHKDVLFVIITAYEYFQHAKDAVNLGVFEYLLKPLNKHKVMKTLQDIHEVIYHKREIIKKEMMLREKIDKILPHVEGQFMYSQLFNSNIIKDITFYEEIFGMKLKKGYVMMAILEEIKLDKKEDNLKNSLVKQKFYDAFKMELKNACPCLMAPPLLDRVVAYIPVEEDADAYQIRNAAITYAKSIAKRLRPIVSIPYKIGIGKSYDIDYFSQSANEAYIAVSISNQDTVIHYEDVQLPSSSIDIYPASKEKMLIHKILTGNMEEALGVFEEIYWWMTGHYEMDVDKVKSKLIELLILIQRSIPQIMNSSSIIEENYLLQIVKINSMEELKLSYSNYLKTTILNLEDSKEKEIKGLITKAIKYIDKNLHKNINLNDVAEDMNMSYHYFSRFFKESIGKNFVDYLTDLRIQKSKEILKDVTVNIKEVCFMVGYSDPNYFSKIFKKVTGMTPTEYRNSVLSQGVI